jgi:uncharacterized membrane protein
MSAPDTVFVPTHLSAILMVGVLQYLMPRLTRADLWFAVTVDPAFRRTDEARRSERTYQRSVIAQLLIALAVALLGVGVHQRWLLPVGLFWELIGATAAFVAARQRTLPHAVAPTTVREAALGQRRDPMPGGWALQLGPFGLLTLTAVWLHLHWSQIPERVPTHFSGSGLPDAWAPRSWASVYAVPVTGLAACLLLWLIALLVRNSRRIQATGVAAVSERTFRRVTLAVVLGSEYVVAWTCGLIALAIVGDARVLLSMTPLLTAMLFLVICLVYLRTGQGGSRLAPSLVAAAPVGDRTRDRDWKWGLFYVNRRDPALLVEKRFGIGYTLNFGHAGSWILLGLIVLVPQVVRWIMVALQR